MGAFVAIAYMTFLGLSMRRWHLPTSTAWLWLGGLTYPLYLFHAQTGRILWLALPGSDWVRSGEVLLLSLLIAAILARYSERGAVRALHSALDGLERRIRSLSTAQDVPDRKPQQVD
jgi:peptidoglycan/LPS O-acetylase OafA/YrhL